MEQSPSAALHHLLRASHLAGPDDRPAVLAHQEGALDDDATTVLIEWAGDVAPLVP